LERIREGRVIAPSRIPEEAPGLKIEN
jgi:hypothetical protein